MPSVQHPPQSRASSKGETRWLWALSRPVVNISKEDFHPLCENLFLHLTLDFPLLQFGPVAPGSFIAHL